MRPTDQEMKSKCRINADHCSFRNNCVRSSKARPNGEINGAANLRYKKKIVNFLNKPNNFETEFDQENARAVHKTTSKRREGTETA